VLSVGAASAKVKTRMLTFGTDFWVGDTLVKRGTYKVTYDEKTGEVSLSDRQKNTLAKATAKVEQRESAKAGWDVVLAPKGGGVALVSLSFPGDRQNLVLGDSTAAGSNATAGSVAAP
ncbi:MAG: hypothetical protein QOC99_3267, partial [Acidobacteriota bacterium]|nr:hypothetical protein [Acidobacteriota bacterium]